MAMRYPAGVDFAAAAAAGFILDRCTAVPALIGKAEDFLFVTGLAGTARDIAALTHDSAQIYTMAGAMGGAVMIGLGLALARPDKRVLVATGDGELLMNVGALATVAIMNPANFVRPLSSTMGIMARPAGRRATPASASTWKRSRSAPGSSAPARSATEGDLADGARLLREGNGSRLYRAARHAGRPARLQAQFRPRRLPQPFPWGAARRLIGPPKFRILVINSASI